MESKQSRSNGDYDVPIEKPFEQLPAWFIDNLNSRFTTKKFPKNAAREQPATNGHHRPQPREDRAS